MLKPAASQLPPKRVDRFEYKAVLPRCTVGSRQAEHESQGVDGRGRYSNKVGNNLRRHKRGEPIRREGLQARGIYKEVPRPSRRLGLATR